MPAHPVVTAAPVLGVLGGMGPLASAAFLQTVYEVAVEQVAPAAEQQLPRCLLDSDPAMPDRTEAILSGHTEELTRLVSDRIEALVRLGATRVVMTCVTAHHLIDRLDPGLRARLISVVDAVFAELDVAGEGRFLMLATTGTRKARTFERSAHWPAVAHRVVVPPPDAQDEIHYLLYRLKREPVSAELVERFERLADRFDCQGVIAGCTEMHLVTRWRRAHGGGPVVLDPLLGIATGLRKLTDEETD
ncbi:aspartate/glutamate racemase family protein [Dactylosporangium maewongense]|uniref:aspartate/glutamate racemase family protein n=1 Tax=Dactylosporangium maewongense TaxID=634393 RepID=UPI0031D40881